MKLVTDDKVLDLSIKLLNNDKLIQEQLLENEKLIQEQLLENENTFKEELDKKVTTEEVENTITNALTIKEF